MTTTNAGYDYQAALLGSPSSNGSGAYAPANYIGLSADTATPNPTATVLPGEISSGTLVRAQATYAHVNGTDTYTLTYTFTSDQTITIAKYGIFNASSGGTLLFETLLSSPASLVSGDQVTIVETVTL